MAEAGPGAAASLPAERVRRWLEDARTGDDSAFAALVEAHNARVFRTAYRLLGEFEDARDVTQEVFVRLHRNLSRLRADGAVEGWLYRVTVNVARDVGRRRARRERLYRLWGSRPRFQDAEGPRRIAEDETRGRMHALLRMLPTREREVIILRDIEGLSTREVAGTLGTTENTVRSQISRGRVRLRKLYEELYDDQG